MPESRETVEESMGPVAAAEAYLVIGDEINCGQDGVSVLGYTAAATRCHQMCAHPPPSLYAW